MITNFDTYMNESIRDLMKSKTKKEIREEIKNMSPDDRLSKGINNNIPWIIEDALKDGAKVTSFHINRATTFDTLEIFNMLKKYKDKKINESLVKSYPYIEIVIKVDNIDQVKKYQNFINDVIQPLRQEYDMSRECVYTFPNYIFINVKAYHYDKTFDVCYLGDGDRGYMGDLYDEQITAKPYTVNQHIFTVSDSDLKTVESILKYGIEQRFPSYEPRKISRTLESVNLNNIRGFNFPHNYPYNSIVIAFKDEEEVEIVKKELFRIFKDNESIMSFLKNNISNEKRYIRIIKNDNIYTMSGGLLENIKVNSNMHGFTYEKIFTFDDFIKRFFVPSYEPRKISRTLESLSINVNDSDYFKKYNTLFIEIKPDYFSSYDEFEKIIEKLEYIFNTKFEDLEEIYDNVFNKHSYIRFTKTENYINVGYGTFDMLNNIVLCCSLTYKRLYLINEIKSELGNNLHNILYDAPSYKSRKISRTLESKLNENFIIADFPYSGITFKVNNFYEVGRIVEFFHDKLKIESYNETEVILNDIKNFYEEDGEYNYISIDLTGSGFFMILKKEQMEEFTTYDQTIYTVSDLYKFSPDIPSYSPRKITRTLEGVKNLMIPKSKEEIFKVFFNLPLVKRKEVLKKYKIFDNLTEEEILKLVPKEYADFYKSVSKISSDSFINSGGHMIFTIDKNEFFVNMNEKRIFTVYVDTTHVKNTDTYLAWNKGKEFNNFKEFYTYLKEKYKIDENDN